MKLVEIIFSPTGGTERVARIITGQWGENIIRFDLSDAKSDFSKCEIDSDDEVLVAMPVFASRPPAVAIERLIQIRGNGAKCTLLCVYGNGDYGNSIGEMVDAAEKCGFHVTSAIAAIAQHSIISEYATDRPDEDDRRQLIDFAEKIRTKNGPISTHFESPPTIEVSANDSKPQPPSAPPLPKPGESCIKCGICLEKCPVVAISSDDFEADVMKCIFCMRCVKMCPNQCRKVDEEVVSMAAVALRDTCSIRKENELFL